MAGYFNFFPSTNFSSNIVTNITAKVKFDQSVQQNLALFYPYTIQQGERADQIAARVYNDPTLDWIIYLSNNILDPYYDWPLSQEQFNLYILAKYGSIPNAQEIAFYRNNFLNDDSLLSPNTYESLSGSLKKYYVPVLGFNENIISYKRKQLDTVVETNIVQSLTLSSVTGLLEGEKIIQSSSSGFITYIGSNHIILNKVTGNITTGSITGQTSKVTSTVTSTSILNYSIPLNEISFYSPVTFLEYEEELNESKFNIKILDKSYIGKIQKDMRELLS